MTDIHNFMSQFKTEYEVKWGHGYDDSLGHKIKITILVTGFGLEDILTQSEQQELATEEEIRLAAEREEAARKAREEEDKWVKQYYGEYIDSRPNAEIVLLTLDELDDDTLIAFMEDKPAYKRTAKEVQQMRRKGEEPVRPQSMSFSSPAANQGKKPKSGGTVISFR